MASNKVEVKIEQMNISRKSHAEFTSAASFINIQESMFYVCNVLFSANKRFPVHRVDLDILTFHEVCKGRFPKEVL